MPVTIGIRSYPPPTTASTALRGIAGAFRQSEGDARLREEEKRLKELHGLAILDLQRKESQAKVLEESELSRKRAEIAAGTAVSGELAQSANQRLGINARTPEEIGGLRKLGSTIELQKGTAEVKTPEELVQDRELRILQGRESATKARAAESLSQVEVLNEKEIQDIKNTYNAFRRTGLRNPVSSYLDILSGGIEEKVKTNQALYENQLKRLQVEGQAGRLVKGVPSASENKLDEIGEQISQSNRLLGSIRTLRLSINRIPPQKRESFRTSLANDDRKAIGELLKSLPLETQHILAYLDSIGEDSLTFLFNLLQGEGK